MMQSLMILAATAVAGFGPISNPDDQFRFIWGGHDAAYTNLIGIGLNTVIDYGVGYWDYQNDRPEPEKTLQARIARRRAQLDRYLKDGVSAIEQLQFENSKVYAQRFPRVNRDGTKDSAHLQAAPAATRPSRRNGGWRSC